MQQRTDANGANGANGLSKPRVLVPEKVAADGLALLRKTLHVDERKGLSPDQLLELIPDYEALIVRSETKVTAALLQAGRKLKVVARAGVGVDNVGMYSEKKGLEVLYVGDWCAKVKAARCRGCDEARRYRGQLAVREYRCGCGTYHCSDAFGSEECS
jgi:hypothetical protein